MFQQNNKIFKNSFFAQFKLNLYLSLSMLEKHNMEDLFISEINIKKVRHLENLNIPLSKTERKHLVLTGKNGSGKTSVLEAMIKYLKSIEWKFHIIDNEKGLQEAIKNYENQITYLKGNSDEDTKQRIESLKKNVLGIKNTLDELNKAYGIDSIKVISQFDEILNKYQSGNFLLTYFEAKRGNQNRNTRDKNIFTPPDGIKKIDLKEKYGFEEKVNSHFIQYLVNLKAEQSFARDDKETKTVEKIETWFENFEGLLQKIFEDDGLTLKFDRKNFNFQIITQNREPVDFNTLSDGYSAILSIVSELILRMEGKVAKVYDIQGIVLIDELETHLHVSLQKEIFSFLTAFFPKIQFIVTTHSPIVLSTARNAVIYDLETQQATDNLEELSYNAIMETYFKEPVYAPAMLKKIERFEELCANVETLDEDESKELVNIEIELSNLSPTLSTEMRSRYRIARKVILQPKS